MNIGILTYHNIPNFGAILQAYSLCAAVRQLGVDCEIIDYSCENIKKRELTFHSTGNKLKDFFLKSLIWPRTYKKINACNDFIVNSETVSKQKYDINSIADARYNYDLLISGSDMIWNLDVNGYDYSYFLDFLGDNIPRISYGSSIGKEIKQCDIDKIKELLNKYKRISVREEDTARYLKEKLNLQCELVCDPTMLMKGHYWYSFVKPVKESNYVLVYFPYKEILNAAKTYAKKNNKKVIVVNNGLAYKGIINKALNTPGEWISYINYADAVFTDSYHGILFSLYLQKQVWTNNTGNRIQSLFDKLSLKNCFISNDTQFENIINYKEINSQIEAFRETSLDYLQSSIFNETVKNNEKCININSSLCCGCSACETICPKHAIKLLTDEKGFYVPKVDSSECINCGLCSKNCPAIDKYIPTEDNIKSFAFKNVDETARRNSASGGFSPAIAELFIKKLNGYICGCVLSEDLVPEHIVTNKIEDIKRIQDSKYVQSNMRKCFSEIAELLKKDCYVLFIGTSCQCRGLKTSLATKNTNMDKLLTVDFFCHGVPSPLIFNEYKGFYEKETGKRVTGYRFRSKKYGWGKISKGAYHMNSVIYSRKEKNIVDDKSFLARLWRRIFFSNLTLRENCFKCPYAVSNKPADITMGDFWGVHDFFPEYDDGKGVSLLICQNRKAETFLSQLNPIMFKEVETSTVLKKQKNAFESSIKPVEYENFWNDYSTKGFDYCIRKYFGYSLKNRIKSSIKLICFKFGLKDYSN